MERPVDISTLPYFPGFPYIVIRLGAALYRIIPLPAAWPREAMWDATLRQARVNGLPVCLAEAATGCSFYDPDADRIQTSGVPRAGIHPPGPLVAVEGVRELVDALGSATEAAPPELAARVVAYREYRIARNGTGIVGVLGDPNKAGRRANLDDYLRLREPRPDGTPAGLSRCAECGEWKGEVLDSEGGSPPLVLRIHCICENRNRCAGCGELLASRKLNGNEYDAATGRVWHTGGTAALGHGCGGTAS
jgi:hypothetical protein